MTPSKAPLELPAQGSPRALLEALERDGAAIVRGFLDAEQVAALRSELGPAIDACEPGSRSGDAMWELLHGRNTKRLCGLVARSPAFLPVLLDPRLASVADHLLLPSCGSYWLNTAQLVAIGPGESAQMLHRDEASWPHLPWPGFEILVGCMIALTPFTAENGATRVVPGSHAWRDGARQPAAEEVRSAAMPEGSALLYTGKLVHGGGANRTAEEWRIGLHLSFLVGWLRPEENHYLAVPLERARGLPERARQLLGYASYHPARVGGRLGLVDFEDVGPVVAGGPTPQELKPS